MCNAETWNPIKAEPSQRSFLRGAPPFVPGGTWRLCDADDCNAPLSFSEETCTGLDRHVQALPQIRAYASCPTNDDQTGRLYAAGLALLVTPQAAPWLPLWGPRHRLTVRLPR